MADNLFVVSGMRTKENKPPLNPTHSTNPTPAICPNALHHITGGEYVRFVGYNWSFFLPPIPPFTPNPAIYLPEEILGILIKALPKQSSQDAPESDDVSAMWTQFYRTISCPI